MIRLPSAELPPIVAAVREFVATEVGQGDRGIVTVETIATSQRGDRVCSYTRHVLVPKKSHATLGEGKVPY